LQEERGPRQKEGRSKEGRSKEGRRSRCGGMSCGTQPATREGNAPTKVGRVMKTSGRQALAAKAQRHGRWA